MAEKSSSSGDKNGKNGKTGNKNRNRQKASSRPIWSGSITFGLVTIPIRLFTAVREKRIAFRSLHDQDKVPLKQKLYCPADGKDVHAEHIVKGYEIEKDRYVVVRQEELDAAAPEATKAIEISDFVDMNEIDPVFFDRPYYVSPLPQGAKAYRLLLEAMRKSRKVGIASVVMHNKQYLAAVRPLEDEDLMLLETMHYNDEVVAADSVPDAEAVAGKANKVDEREMKIAQQLIDSLSTGFEPERYKDAYREQVMELIERKAAGEQIVTRPEREAAPTRGGRDLMAALEASLERARGGKEPARPAAAKTTARRRSTRRRSA